MHFDPPLLTGRLIRRYKRFLADIELADGRIVVAHCPNPGSMSTCAPERARVWLSVKHSPTRKLPYTWELVEVAPMGDDREPSLVCVNTGRANELVAEALSDGRIAELRGYSVRREVRYGQSSRIDFLLSRPASAGGSAPEALCYVEVKSVTLDGGDGVAAFPDSVTARGTRHLGELMDMVAAGHRAVLLFVCNRSGARAIRPADEVDPLYGYTLRRARAAGVEILAYRSRLSPDAMVLDRPIPLELPALDYIPPPPRPRRQAARRRGGKKTAVM